MWRRSRRGEKGVVNYPGALQDLHFIDSFHVLPSYIILEPVSPESGGGCLLMLTDVVKAGAAGTA